MFSLISLKAQPSDLRCPMFSLKVSDLQTHNSQQQQQQHSHKQPTNPKPCPASASLLYTVINKEVEQQFSGRGMTL
jgi:hypothetical protein